MPTYLGQRCLCLCYCSIFIPDTCGVTELQHGSLSHTIDTFVQRLYHSKTSGSSNLAKGLISHNSHMPIFVVTWVYFTHLVTPSGSKCTRPLWAVGRQTMLCSLIPEICLWATTYSVSRVPLPFRRSGPHLVEDFSHPY